MMQGQTVLMLRWRSFSEWGRERNAFSFVINVAYNTFMNGCIQLPVRLPKMQDQKLLMCSWLSSSGWSWECVSLGCDYKGGQYIRKGWWYTKVNLLQLAVWYLNPTINRNTRKPEPEIESDRSSISGPNLAAGMYPSGFGPPRCSRSGF